MNRDLEKILKEKWYLVAADFIAVLAILCLDLNPRDGLEATLAVFGILGASLIVVIPVLMDGGDKKERLAEQARLRTALGALGCGETLTYGDLAQQLHSAPRAVGQALGSNPIPIIVPCHRIISAGKNRLTGFGHTREGPKITLKAWLLELEARA